MCDRIEIPGSELRGKISAEFTRDASMRTTEVIIVNHNVEGEEMQGMRVLCHDDGFVAGGVSLYQGVDIVGRAEMRG